MRAQHPARAVAETWLLLLVIAMSDLTSGGVQGPIEGFNSLSDFTTSPSAIAVGIPGDAADAAAAAVADAAAPPSGYAMSSGPKWVEPYFDPSTPRNVTALVGKSAYLSCRVRNLGNKTVSWIRHRDIHILTVGSYTYTSDQRFQATHHQESDDWTLQIKWAQKRDGGMYECQISTQPVRSYFVRLNVVVPTATILGGPDLHVDKGSTINLTCTVKFSPEPPAYIFWYHHEEVINYDSSRGGVSVITEKGDVTTSFLLIQNADLADSGKYSCAPSNADVASVRVHVLNGEHPEAMQTGTSGCQYSWLTIFLLLSLLLCYNRQLLTLNATNVLITATPTAPTATTTRTTTTPTTTGRPTAVRVRAATDERKSAAKTTTTTTTTTSTSVVEDTAVTVVVTAAATTKATATTTIGTVASTTTTGAAARRRHQLRSRPRDEAAATDTADSRSQDVAHNSSGNNNNNNNSSHNSRIKSNIGFDKTVSIGDKARTSHSHSRSESENQADAKSRSCRSNCNSNSNNNSSSKSTHVVSTWPWLR